MVVSHKATIRLVIAGLLGFDPRGYRDRLDQLPACLNVVDFLDTSGPRLVLLNDVSHYRSIGESDRIRAQSAGRGRASPSPASLLRSAVHGPPPVLRVSRGLPGPSIMSISSCVVLAQWPRKRRQRLSLATWRWVDLMPAAIVMATAMGLRLAAINVLGPLPLSRSPQLDSREYLLWAQHLAERGFVWPEYPEHAPGYSFFLGRCCGCSMDRSRPCESCKRARVDCCVFTAPMAARHADAEGVLAGRAAASLLRAACVSRYCDSCGATLDLFADVVAGSRDECGRPPTAAGFSLGFLVGFASIIRPTDSRPGRLCGGVPLESTIQVTSCAR